MSKMEMTPEELQAKIDAAVDEATKGLKENRDKALGKLDALKKELKDIEDAKEQAVQDALAKDGKHEELVARLKESHTTTVEDLRTQLADATSGLDKVTKNLRKVVVDKELTTLFADAGVTDKNLLKAAVTLNSPLAVVTDGENDGDDIVVTINGELLSTFITTWSEAEGKSFISNGNTGGGAGSGDGSGTDEFEQFFKPGTINLTKQNELRQTDPERYEALKKQYTAQDGLPLVAPQQHVVG